MGKRVPREVDAGTPRRLRHLGIHVERRVPPELAPIGDLAPDTYEEMVACHKMANTILKGVLARRGRASKASIAQSQAAKIKRDNTAAKLTLEVRATIKRTRKWGLAAVVKELRQKHGVQVGRDTVKAWRLVPV